MLRWQRTLKARKDSDVPTFDKEEPWNNMLKCKGMQKLRGRGSMVSYVIQPLVKTPPPRNLCHSKMLSLLSNLMLLRVNIQPQLLSPTLQMVNQHALIQQELTLTLTRRLTTMLS